jgi:hypothetical protein
MYQRKIKPSVVFCSSVGFWKPSENGLHTYSGLVSGLVESEQKAAFGKVLAFSIVKVGNWGQPTDYGLLYKSDV